MDIELDDEGAPPVTTVSDGEGAAPDNVGFDGGLLVKVVPLLEVVRVPATGRVEGLVVKDAVPAIDCNTSALLLANKSSTDEACDICCEVAESTKLSLITEAIADAGT